MCTLTFQPRPDGYQLSMNRDEQRGRGEACPPERFESGRRVAVSPYEPGGGTWISLNDAGVSLALLNWYAVSARVSGVPVSRGRVVQAARFTSTTDETRLELDRLPWERIPPCRLIGVFPATKQVVEWYWDLRVLTCRPHPWSLGHWISSGFNEPLADQFRRTSFKRQFDGQATPSGDSVRAAHGSHWPQAGPFSICMHRDDAVTVSYTEITVNQVGAAMLYLPGSPCEGWGREGAASVLTLEGVSLR